MFDIENKDKLISEIVGNIISEYYCAPSTNTDLRSSSDLEDYICKVAFEVAKQVSQDVCKVAVKEIITRLYTHNEFERDLGIRD